MKTVISPEQSYTFHDYFRMRVSTDDILEYFGYVKENVKLDVPRSQRELPNFENLQFEIHDTLLHISLENEITRREFLIAPIMALVRRLTAAKLRSEYWFEFNDQLKGSLDYFLKRDKHLLVVEAKNADLTRGFRQLAVEMIALDKSGETDQPILYGAVTTGEEWRFAELERATNLIRQDLNIYYISKDLENILQNLVGILENKK